MISSIHPDITAFAKLYIPAVIKNESNFRKFFDQKDNKFRIEHLFQAMVNPFYLHLPLLPTL